LIFINNNNKNIKYFIFDENNNEIEIWVKKHL
jgi:hypothetical protein